MKFFSLAILSAFFSQQALARPVEEEFWSISGFDSDSGYMRTILNEDDDTKMKWCMNNRRCVAFSTEGIMKKELKPRSQWTPNTANGFKVFIKKSYAIPADSYEGYYELYSGWNHGANSYAQADGDVETLKSVCAARRRCTSFHNSGSLKSGFTHQKDWTYTAASGTLYFKGKYAIRLRQRSRFTNY
jgi:hypothetical protein